MTAADLLRRLVEAGCDPAVEGADLTLDADPPAELEPLVGVLHTGLRAILSGRRWFAFDAAGRGCGPRSDHALDPGRLLPRGATHVCVEGFAWNSLDGCVARHPELFEPPAAAPQTPTRRPADSDAPNALFRA